MMKDLFIKYGIMMLVIIVTVPLMLTLPPEFMEEHGGVVYIGVFTIFLLALYLPKLIHKTVKLDFKDYISLENIPAEFENMYENLYNNHIQALEKLRKKVRWRTAVQYISLALFIIGYVFIEAEEVVISRKIDSYIMLIGIISLFITIIFTVMNMKYKKKYVESYKKEIVSSFIKLINHQLNYNPLDVNRLKIQGDYKKAGFDNKRFNRFYPDDYTYGIIEDDINIEMCDLHVQNHTGSGKNSHTEEIFQGIFAYTKCNKNIGTYIKVSKNKIKILEQQNRVEMDSEEFEEYFDIYSENKILAMQLLTSDIMETLIEFHNKYYLNYEIVFRDDIIYIRFFTGAMFEPKIFGNSMDKELLYIYYCIFKFIVDITKKANKILQEIDV